MRSFRKKDGFTMDRNGQNQIAQQLCNLLNGLQNTGIYVVDEQYRVLFCNSGAGFLAGAERCFEVCGNRGPCQGCPLQAPGKNFTVLGREDQMIDTRAYQTEWDGEPAFAVSFQPHAAQAGENEKTLVRMNRAMQRAVDVYTEINLETGAYRQIDFTRHVFHIENEGDYRDAFAYITAHEIDPEDAPRVKKILSPQKLAETAANDSGPEELFVRYRMKNLQPTVWMESRAIFIRGEQPGYACIIATDVTAQMEYQKEPLTGLLNRRTMEQNVEASLKTAKNGRNVTFLAIDVDSFKHVNDELGHEAGDRLLVQIADILREEFRRSDLISRMGGDEFAVFIPNGLPPKVLKQKVEHTLVRVQQISRQEHWEVPTGVSIGSCTAAGHEMTFAQLYRNADHAMYHEKRHHHA